MKAKKLATCLILAALIITTLIVGLTYTPNDQRPTYSEVFRPFYLGAQPGISGPYTSQTNLSVVDREWNFEGWTVQRLAMNIQWCKYNQSGAADTPEVTLYVSQDAGNSYPTAIKLARQTVNYDQSIPGGFFAANASYDLTACTAMFGSSTRIIPEINPADINTYLSVVYCGDGQLPVPPYDYIDAQGNYVQYNIQFTVDYKENQIRYGGQTLDYPADVQSKIKNASDMIVKTMQPSGAGNEVVTKQFGTDTWIVIYSTELGMVSLVDASKALPNENYLPTVRHFIPWLFSKQNADGSFYFTLTDGDQHAWSNASAQQWYGSDKIDSYSALSITLMRKYYDATGDQDFLNRYYPQLVLSKNFLTELMDTTLWIPVDGYHYNNQTGYSKSTISQLHDSAEVYQGLKDYAYLEGIRGNTEEQTRWNTYADQIATGIRLCFWNETLQRYSGCYDLAAAKQQTAPIYSQLVPVIYGIETNSTRASLTVQSYTVADVKSNSEEQTRTTNTMLTVALAKLKVDFNVSEPWLIEASNLTTQLLTDSKYQDSMLVETSAWQVRALLETNNLLG